MHQRGGIKEGEKDPLSLFFLYFFRGGGGGGRATGGGYYPPTTKPSGVAFFMPTNWKNIVRLSAGSRIFFFFFPFLLLERRVCARLSPKNIHDPRAFYAALNSSTMGQREEVVRCNSVSADWYFSRLFLESRRQNATPGWKEIRAFVLNRLRERHWNSSESNDEARSHTGAQLLLLLLADLNARCFRCYVERWWKLIMIVVNGCFNSSGLTFNGELAIVISSLFFRL